MCKTHDIDIRQRSFFGSDIYKVETLNEFSGERAGMKDQKDSFMQVNYRVKNIRLVDALKKSTYRDNEHIQKVCKGLMCCSSMAGVQVGPRSAEIFNVSGRCRRPFCPKCNQLQAGKFRNRFLRCYNSKECGHLFEGKYFYFITLTLQHDKKNRNYVYLKDLKGYVRRLRDSKIWKHHFPFSSNEMDPNYMKSGYAQSYEMTMTDNGYHIHSHIFMCAPPLKGRVRVIEQAFRDKWEQITGDSTGFRLDLVRIDPRGKTGKALKDGKLTGKLQQKLSETFKYTVKVGNIHSLRRNPYKIDMFARWIIETKGKKMITSNGFFKGLQLFALKSKWDEKEAKEPFQPEDHCRYYVGKTEDLVFNLDKDAHYDKKDRENHFHKVYLRFVPPSFIDITGCFKEFEKYFNICYQPQEIDKDLHNWVKTCELDRAREMFLQGLISDPDEEITPEDLEELGNLILGNDSDHYQSQYEVLQLELFEDF